MIIHLTTYPKSSACLETIIRQRQTRAYRVLWWRGRRLRTSWCGAAGGSACGTRSPRLCFQGHRSGLRTPAAGAHRRLILWRPHASDSHTWGPRLPRACLTWKRSCSSLPARKTMHDTVAIINSCCTIVGFIVMPSIPHGSQHVLPWSRSQQEVWWLPPALSSGTTSSLECSGSHLHTQ